MEKTVILLILIVAVHGMPRIHIPDWNKGPEKDIQPYILNGQDADAGEWPWQVTHCDIEIDEDKTPQRLLRYVSL